MFGKIVSWIGLALLCSYLIKILLFLDLNKRVFNHTPGPCRHISGIEDGSEDLELLSDGTVLISSGLKWGDGTGLRNVKGRIFLYDLKKKTYKAEELKLEGVRPESFFPHGLSSYESKGRTTVYVVNHAPEGDSVECFTLNKEKKTLVHTKSIKNDLIYSANDLVAVGPDKFFLSNDHYFRNGFLKKLEMLLMLTLGNVIYYDGKAQLVDQWLMTPNGVAVSNDKKHLYVALPAQETVRIYNVSLDHRLVKNADMTLLTSPDNIFVDKSTGDLWLGAHPVAVDILRHLADPRGSPAPSQVLHVRVQGAQDRWVVTEPYADDGTTLQGSSSAVFRDAQLLVGTVFHKLLHCDVSNPEIV